MQEELDEELSFHLEMATAKHLAEGKSPEEAQRLAHQAFGHLPGHRRRAQDAWGLSALDDLGADLRFALRQFGRRPTPNLLAVLTLALGLGGTLALWGVVSGVLLRPLPFPAEERIVTFWDPGDWFGVEFDFVRERIQGFEHLAAFAQDRTTLERREGTSLLPFVAASGEFFDLLGVEAQWGRTFGPEDDLPQAEPVVVLSHGMWQQDFGGDPDLLGRQLVLGGVPTTVIGVMPPEFFFPDPEPRAWRPLRLDPASDHYAQNGFLELMGRVDEETAAEPLASSIEILAQALGERFDYPEAWDKSNGAHVTPLRDLLLGSMGQPLWLLFVAAGILLLMACANVAALLLTRTVDRGGELAVRSALGAGRGRLARQLLAESALLVLLATALGLGLATAFFETLVSSLPLGPGFRASLQMPWSSLAASFFLGGFVVLAVSLLSVRSQARARPDLGRSGRARGPSRREARLQHRLVTVEAFLAVSLTLGAMLLIRSVTHLQEVDPGFETEGVLAVDLVADGERMDVPSRRRFFDRVVESVQGLPGVESVALTNRLLLRDQGFQGPVRLLDRPELEEGRWPSSYYRTGSSDFFEVLGIEIVQGRAFKERDRLDGEHVVVVGSNFAERLWPGENPIGQRLSTEVGGDGQVATVVGVAEEVRVSRLVGENSLVIYRPQAQRTWPGVDNTLVLRTNLEPAVVASALRQRVHELDPRVAVAGMTAMDLMVQTKMSAPLRLRFFLSLFAVLGLVLGAVGIYGVVAHGVLRRKKELGLRLALGATPAEVWRGVVGSGLRPVLLGVLGGLLASLGWSGVLRRFLFGVEPTDPASLLVAGTLLFLAGAFAASIPGWQASRVDPSKTLRSE